MKIEQFIKKACECDETLFFKVNQYVQGFKRKTARKNATLTLAVTDELINMLDPFEPTHYAIMVIVSKELFNQITEGDAE